MNHSLKMITIAHMLCACLFWTLGCGASAEDAPETGSAPRLLVSDPVRIGSGASPLDGTCGKKSDGFTFRKDVETDPRLVITGSNPAKIAVAFMRDPILAVSVAMSDDGGGTWRESEPPGLSPCTGTDFNTYGDQDLAIGPDGRLYLASTQGDFTPEGVPLEIGAEYWMNSRVVVSTSDDFGETWSEPTVVSPMGEYQHTSLVVADPDTPGTAHVAWHVRANPSQPEGTTPHLDDQFIHVSTTTDGGVTWSAADPVMRSDGALDIVRFSDGELLVAGLVGESMAVAQIGFSRRAPNDAAWSVPRTFPLQSNTSFFMHPEQEMVLAIDMPIFVGADDVLYLVASLYDPDSNTGRIQVSRSFDRGESWTEPVSAAQMAGPAWNAAIGAAPGGAVGVFWYDGRDDVGGDGAITTRARFAASVDDGESWVETALSEPFDLVQGPRPHVLLYLGNYFEVKPVGPGSFGIAYTVAPPLSTGASDLNYVEVTVAQ